MAETKTQAAAPAAKTAETKAAKFARLAPPRIQNALDKIALIGNLASKSGYEYTPEQVAKIKTALEGAVKAVTDRFAPDAKDQSGTGFSF